MTGPEHYAEAERLLEEFGREVEADLDALPMIFAHMQTAMTRAQAHATLALAAATALPHVGDMFVVDHDAWCDVASAHPATPDRAS